MTGGPKFGVGKLIRQASSQRGLEGQKQLETLDPEKQARVNDFKVNTELKIKYAYWFVLILICQLLTMNAIFIMVGRKILQFDDPKYLQIYMGGTMAEVFGVVFVITRYLFSKKDHH